MNPPRRRWFAFSLRMLFVAVALLAIPLGWLGYQWRIVQERKAMLDDAVQRGGSAFRWAPNLLFQGDTVNRVPIVRRLMGDQAIAGFWLPESIPESDADLILKAFPEAIGDINPGNLRGRLIPKRP